MWFGPREVDWRFFAFAESLSIQGRERVLSADKSSMGVHNGGTQKPVLAVAI